MVKGGGEESRFAGRGPLGRGRSGSSRCLPRYCEGGHERDSPASSPTTTSTTTSRSQQQPLLSSRRSHPPPPASSPAPCSSSSPQALHSSFSHYRRGSGEGDQRRNSGGLFSTGVRLSDGPGLTGSSSSNSHATPGVRTPPGCPRSAARSSCTLKPSPSFTASLQRRERENRDEVLPADSGGGEGGGKTNTRIEGDEEEREREEGNRPRAQGDGETSSSSWWNESREGDELGDRNRSRRYAIADHL